MCFCYLFKVVAVLYSSDSWGITERDELQGTKSEYITEILRRYIHVEQQQQNNNRKKQPTKKKNNQQNKQTKTRQPELIKCL